MTVFFRPRSSVLRCRPVNLKGRGLSAAENGHMTIRRYAYWQANYRGNKQQTNNKEQRNLKTKQPGSVWQIFCYSGRQKLRKPLACEKAFPVRWLPKLEGAGWFGEAASSQALESSLHILSATELQKSKAPSSGPEVTWVRLICPAGFQLGWWVLCSQSSVTFRTCNCSWYWAFPAKRVCPQVHSAIRSKPVHSSGWSNKPFLGFFPDL